MAHLSRTLRAFDIDIDEQAWEQRVIRRLITAPNTYLVPMQNNLNEQFSASYSLQAGETWETHSTYVVSQTFGSAENDSEEPDPMHRVMIDWTVPCDLPYDNIVPDVMVVTMPLSRLPEMAEVAIAMFAPQLGGSQREPLPKQFIFANLIDHMACEGLLQD